MKSVEEVQGLLCACGHYHYTWAPCSEPSCDCLRLKPLSEAPSGEYDYDWNSYPSHTNDPRFKNGLLPYGDESPCVYFNGELVNPIGLTKDSKWWGITRIHSGEQGWIELLVPDGNGGWRLAKCVGEHLCRKHYGKVVVEPRA